MLWPAIPAAPAIEGTNHQGRAGRSGKECAARVHVQAAAENAEQKHNKQENQRVVLPSMHRIHSFRSAVSGCDTVHGAHFPSPFSAA
jgi:hypothetical protein